MATWDDVERRRCGLCGERRDVRSMTELAGKWLCRSCYNFGKLRAAALNKEPPTDE